MDMEKMKPKEDIAYDQFKEMEKRYHTWMNYYSLFNGALLVAYCTILVSTGQVIEMGGAISTENGLIGNARLFQLECTYWNILALIALLGCFASYCWYLSAIGHYHWIEVWRKTIKGNKNYPELIFRNIRICDKRNKAIHFHSTFKITKFFILIVLYAWLYVCYSSFFNHDFGLNRTEIIFISSLWGMLFLLEYVLHCIIGSDLSSFKKRWKLKSCICHLCISIPKWLKIIMFFVCLIITIVFAISNCPNKENFEKDIRLEMKVLESDKDSVTTTIKHKL